MDAIHRRDLQFLSLRTAAAVAHIQLIGVPPQGRDIVTIQRVLNDIAHALAVLAPIYATAGAAGIARIGDAALLFGKFQRGASKLVLPDGSEQLGLMVQRRDLDAAITILKHTRLPATLREGSAAAV